MKTNDMMEVFLAASDPNLVLAILRGPTSDLHFG